jgi:hypothetical protein
MKTASALLSTLIVLIALPAFAFEPFTSVTNVCESCEQAPADVVTLTSGEKIRGDVVGENPSFYVVVRYGKARAIPRAEVQSIDWEGGSKPSGVTSGDQILLNNGVVFSGTIIEDKDKPALFQLKSSWTDQTYIVFKSQVKEAYRSGSKVDFAVPSE